MSKPLKSVISLSIVLLPILGCGQQGGTPNVPHLTMEQKIEQIQKSDLPAPVKEKVLADLRAKQAPGEPTK
jgi:hypothetical protein